VYTGTGPASPAPPGFDPGRTLNRLLAVFGSGSLPLFEITLPIGISFYTLESMSYTIDVYRGIVQPARRFSDISCFVTDVHLCDGAEFSR
jgi:hypothetical protein